MTRRKLTPQEAAWKAAAGYRARQKRTRRSIRTSQLEPRGYRKPPAHPVPEGS